MKRKKNRKIKGDVLKGVVITGILIALAVVFVIFRVRMVGESHQVAAYVNGEPIFSSELEQVKRLMATSGQSQLTDSEILDQLINKKLLIQAAKKSGFSVSYSEFNRTMNTYFNLTRTTKEEFDLVLAQQNISYDDFKNDMIQRLIISKYLNATIKPIGNLSEDVLRDYYDKHLGLFTQPEMVNAAHILVRDKGLAEKLLKQIKEGADFAKLARNYSVDSSALQGGKLGWFTASQMVPAFSQAAFSLSIGNVSGIVETQYGYHIIKVLNKTPERIIPFEEAKPQIEMMLKAEKQNEQLLETLKRLREGANIKVFNSSSPNTPPPYTDTKRDICYQNGKPIVSMYMTSKCPHSAWIKPGFIEVANEFKGRIVAHIWELDTGDDLLTPEKETQVPQEDRGIFQSLNPQRSVPTFVFGCRYLRIGARYEATNDISKEEAEFRQIINELLSQ